MQKIHDLKKRLADREVIIMDGATGTEIQRRGIKTTLPLWSAGPLFTHPHVIKEIHRIYQSRCGNYNYKHV
ncbi:hypothetical protein A3A63_01260 [Candidatus Gottesmanbacteria bacterium RIFCSPLOWO2_01_FULL_46_9]|uniref:Hcy-binding domain-containing protein n=1 Tax=Candidatus Gottesmanbacteria bacterium RIFCSPLOWO2_01_FULL_46_9 TaxID=1798394 RepID=A0A1F6B307_9BACT|nr:MAG: hypothetical protein A3A63_01260 [Candidatus Gottesmanbacteria bacterium RIFCSPLOWO2_01_FULL_46_9]